MNRNVLLSSLVVFGMMVFSFGHIYAQSLEDTIDDRDIANTPDTSYSDQFQSFPDMSQTTAPEDMTAYTNPQIPLRITLFPAHPLPGQKALAKVEGFETDLANARIEWSANGEVLGEGPGKTTVNFTVPPRGKTAVLTARATDSRGKKFTATYTLSPGTVSLIWETDTYTPPFFEGKALQSAGSKIRLTAFPTVYDSDGNVIPASELTYTWRQGTKVITELSGKNRQSVTMSNQNVIGPLRVSLDVSSPDGQGYGASASLTLNVVQPKVNFYEDHPLMGIRYDTALPVTTTLSGEEVQIIAEPFYFTADKRNADDLEYSWLINGTESKGLSNTGSAIVLKGAADAKASASIDVRIRNKIQYMQSARQAISVISNPTE